VGHERRRYPPLSAILSIRRCNDPDSILSVILISCRLSESPSGAANFKLANSFFRSPTVRTSSGCVSDIIVVRNLILCQSVYSWLGLPAHSAGKDQNRNRHLQPVFVGSLRMTHFTCFRAFMILLNYNLSTNTINVMYRYLQIPILMLWMTEHH
jgi:hypothetical protein